MSSRCYIVPPHILRHIAQCELHSDATRDAAQATLTAAEHRCQLRCNHFEEPSSSNSGSEQPRGPQRQQIIPPQILQHISETDQVDDDHRERAQRDLGHLEHILDKVTTQQKSLTDASAGDASKGKKTQRSVHDAKNTQDDADLPGELVRAEGDPAVADKAANEVYDNVGIVLDFYNEHFDWKSIDNKNMDVVSSVHFGRNYENAYWDTISKQMVFGDGDDFLNNFTGCIDVIGHELAHAVTDHTSPLIYRNQSGALNEHISDVFGIMVKQKVQDEDAESADWLIGEDCILPGVKGVALRSMKKPGEAFDDPRFGKDPQVGHMKDFKIMVEDQGGVHIFSGIPNKAFHLAAVAFGGYSWEKAGKIWWKTMRSDRVPRRCTFRQFADVTIDCAEELFDKEAADIVKEAWTKVGVIG